MANERFYRAVVQPLFADGTSRGLVRVVSAHGFKVKATVVLESSTQTPLTVEIKAITSSTSIEVGPPGPSMDDRSDVSGFLVADSAKITQPKQRRPSIGPGEIDRATYEEEPTVARRTSLVDEFGNLITEANPLPVTSDAQPSPLTSQAPDTLTTPGFEEIFSFTSAVDTTKLVFIEATVSTASTIRVLIDGTVVRELRTSSLERNAHFEFAVHRPLLTGQVVTVEAMVDRQIFSVYETFTALEGYTS